MNEAGNNAMGMINQAATGGMWFGLYLSVLFLMFVGGDSVAMLSLLAMLMLLCAPLMVLRMLRALYLSDSARYDLYRLWSMSVMIFAFASLICAFVTFVWMQFVHPGFIYEKAQEAVNVYRTIPELQTSDMISVLQKAIDNGELPTPIQFVVQMGWTTVMLGALVSMPLAFIARLGGTRR